MPSFKSSPAIVVVACVLLASGGRLHAAVVHVSPSGSDAGDGSQANPFLTLERALKASSSPVENVVEMDPGIYNYPFPVHLEVSNPLTIRAAAKDSAVLRGVDGEVLPRENALLEIVVARSAGRPAVRVEGLRMERGLTGLVVLGKDGAQFDLTVVQNRFLGQGYQGVEAVVGEEGTALVRIAGNAFDGGAEFGIDIGTRRKASLEVEVEDNRIEGPDAPPPEAGSHPLRFGISLYLDVTAKVHGAFDRNQIVNVPVGVLAVEQGVEGDPGELDLRISNCLIAGSSSPDRNRLDHAFFLAMWPHYRSSVWLLNNTVVNARDHAVRQEEPIVFLENEENLNLFVAGNIFWPPAKGEFSAETDGVLPPHYREVRSNVLTRSARKSIDGNSSLDPRLSSDFQLVEGSPAVDAFALPGRSDPPFWAAVDLLASGIDLKGDCRLRDGDGDGVYRLDPGAFEGPGACAGDERPFTRGDCDMNQSVEITDAVKVFHHLFVSGGPLSCPDACDADDDNDLSITDGIYTLSFLFLGGRPPPAPFPGLGRDPTPDHFDKCR